MFSVSIQRYDKVFKCFTREVLVEVGTRKEANAFCKALDQSKYSQIAILNHKTLCVSYIKW